MSRKNNLIFPKCWVNAGGNVVKFSRDIWWSEKRERERGMEIAFAHFQSLWQCSSPVSDDSIFQRKNDLGSLTMRWMQWFGIIISNLLPKNCQCLFWRDLRWNLLFACPSRGVVSTLLLPRLGWYPCDRCGCTGTETGFARGRCPSMFFGGLGRAPCETGFGRWTVWTWKPKTSIESIEAFVGAAHRGELTRASGPSSPTSSTTPSSSQSLSTKPSWKNSAPIWTPPARTSPKEEEHRAHEGQAGRVAEGRRRRLQTVGGPRQSRGADGTKSVAERRRRKLRKTSLKSWRWRRPGGRQRLSEPGRSAGDKSREGEKINI